MADTNLSRRAVLARGAILASAAALAGAATIPPSGDAAIVAAFQHWLALDPLDATPKKLSTAEMDALTDEMTLRSDALFALPATSAEGLAIKLFVMVSSDCKASRGKLRPDEDCTDGLQSILADAARFAPAIRPHLVLA